MGVATTDAWLAYGLQRRADLADEASQADSFDDLPDWAKEMIEEAEASL